MRFYPLILIVLIGLCLRFFNLGAVPVGFHRDEANFGYNAYTLLHTGRDLTGEFLPIHIASFLYSPAGYSYFTVPFISIFGLTEFAVRFASAFFGTLTIIVTYFLVKELFGKKEEKQKAGEALALLSSLFLAISPWHINLSRVATENVLVVFFISLGVLFAHKWIHKQTLWYILVSFFCFGITLALYQAPRAFLPLFIPFFFLVFYHKELRKKIFLPLGLFILAIVLPIFLILASHNLTQRIRMLSIFQNPATQLVLEEQIREDQGHNVLQTRFFHNKLTNYSITFFENYFSHFSYNFLFTDKGLPDRYRIPQMGLLYFFELPLILFGLWKLFKQHRREAIFLTGWILLAPFGSALTFDDIPNLQRTLIMFPALAIVVGYGFYHFWLCLQKYKFRLPLQIGVVMIMLYGIFYYLHQYYVHQVNHRPWYRQEGYKALIAQVNALQGDYKAVVITNAQTDPAIFFLFYNRYDPSLIQQQLIGHETTSSEKLVLGKYQFIAEPCPLHITGKKDPLTKLPVLSGEKDILYVNAGDCRNIEKRAQVLSEIKRSDGTVVFSLQRVIK